MIDSDPLESALRRGVAGEHGEPLPDLTAAAAAAGLLDVAYATHDSPLGRLLLARTPRGLVQLSYLDDDAMEDAVVAALAERISPRVLAAPRELEQPRRELEQYFAGARVRFEVPLDWSLSRGFAQRVLRATARIPYGSVSSYKQVAAAAGSERAFRAAGNALGAQPAGDRRPVPPGPAHRRGPRRLRGRERAQADAAGARGGSGIALPGPPHGPSPGAAMRRLKRTPRIDRLRWY